MQQVIEKTNYKKIMMTAKICYVIGELIEAINDILYEYVEHQCLNQMYTMRLSSLAWNTRLNHVRKGFKWLRNNEEIR